MSFYGELADDVVELLQELGAPVVFKKPSTATQDGVSGVVMPFFEWEGQFSTVLLPSSSEHTDRFRPAALVRDRYRYGIADRGTTGNELEVGCVFTAEGFEWIVLGVGKVAPTGEVVVYEFGAQMK